MRALSEFLKELIIYDYILFGSLLFIFILFIIIGILLRGRTIAIFLVLFAFLELLVGSTYGYIKMHEYIFKNEISLTNQKKLTFTQAIVVNGTLKNLSKVDFKNCTVTAKAYKVKENKLHERLLQFKPIAKMSIIESNITIGEEREMKLIIEPFTYAGDYNISLGADCR